MAVLAPMPRASVSTVTAVKPGFFSNIRKAKRRSASLLITQRFHRMNARGPSGGRTAGNQRHRRDEGGDEKKGQWIVGADPEEQSAQETGCGQRRHDPQSNAEDGDVESLAQHQPEDLISLRAQRHANSKFVPA